MKEIALSLLAVFILSSCGGGGNNENTANTDGNIKNDDKVITANTTRQRRILSTDAVVSNDSLIKINNHLHKEYESLNIHSVNITLEDNIYKISYDVSASIYNLGPEGESTFSNALSFIEDVIEFYISDKMDKSIKHKSYFYTVDGNEREERADVRSFSSPQYRSQRRTNLNKKVVINPGHGYYLDEETGEWKLQREEYNGIIEDFKTNEIATSLYNILNTQSEYSYSVSSTRDLKNNSTIGASGHLTYEESARQYIKSKLPTQYDVWDKASSGKNIDKDINSRARYSNYLNSDLLVSIHTNGQRFYSCYKKGTKVYYSNSNTSVKESKEFAELILDKIVKKIQDEYDPSWPDGEVIGKAHGENDLSDKPSVIVEVAYHDCDDPDAKALKDPTFISIVNSAMKDSINTYLSGESYFDGAGSVIRTSNDCWGCQHDEARMHPHSIPSTVVFQWTASSICPYLKVGVASGSGGSISNTRLDVTIHTKEWNDHLSTSYRTTLPATISKKAYWNTTAITSQNNLTSTKRIIAECTTLPIPRSSDPKDSKLVKLSNSYYWSGNGSLITKDNTPDYSVQDAGVRQDWAVTFNSNKSLTIFQWQTSAECPSLNLSSSNKSSVNVNQVDLKGWAQKDWPDNSLCNRKLPCKITAPSINNYYLIKIKSNSGAISGGSIHAECGTITAN